MVENLNSLGQRFDKLVKVGLEIMVKGQKPPLVLVAQGTRLHQFKQAASF